MSASSFPGGRRRWWRHRRSLFLSLLPALLFWGIPGTGPAQEPPGPSLPEPGPPEISEEDPTAGLARRDARIRELSLSRNDDVLYADVRMTGAFVGEIRDRIESGLEVTFTWTVELYRKRKWWLNRRLVHRHVQTQVVRDPMNGRYTLVRIRDDEEVARRTTEDPLVVQRWMTRLDKVPLVPLAEVGPDEGSEAEEPRLLLRARAKVKDDFVLLFIPWDFETGWEKLLLDLSQVPSRSTTEPPGTDAADPEGGGGP